jgi:Flp pilus assembly pilin Flp
MRKNQRGASMLEFTLIIILVAVVAIPTVKATGYHVGGNFSCFGLEWAKENVPNGGSAATPFNHYNQEMYVEGFGWFSCIAPPTQGLGDFDDSGRSEE